MSQLPSCIVVGAGPIGLYTARVLASTGCDVTLIDDGQRGAGWASGGMLGAVYETLDTPDFTEDSRRFALESQWLWSRYLSAMKVPFIQRSLFIARDAAEHARLAMLADLAGDWNINLEEVAVPQGLTGVHAWSCAKDVAIDPRALLSVLRTDCAQSGVKIVVDRVTDIMQRHVTCVSGLQVSGDVIIVATGFHPNSPLVDCVPELKTLLPVKGQMLAVTSARTLTNVIRAGRIYLIPRDQNLVIGATSQPQEDDPTCFDEAAHQSLLAEACDLMPSLRREQIVESWAGVRPKTPDGLPLVGYSQIPGVILATGAYRNGWLLAAGIANGIMGLVLGGPDHAKNLQPFAPNRFSNPA